ncbi:MAG: TonB-dependent receptor [Saprospiraceae bacterium]
MYVGDAGVVEPSGRTRRTGVDVGLRYQLSDYLFFDADLNYTYARSIDEPEGADRIPLAPDLTAMCGLSMSLPMGLKGSLRSRFLKDRPANEDNSLVAKGYLITDVNLTYSIKNLSFGFVVENLFDVEWNETQFATESRLQNEPMPVEEIHFTPGTPFFLKGKVKFINLNSNLLFQKPVENISFDGLLC